LIVAFCELRRALVANVDNTYNHRRRNMRKLIPGLASALALVAAAPSVRAVTIDPFYAASYSFTDLGSVPGLPTRYGGLTFLDSDTILIGGAANGNTGRIHTVDVVRGAGNHITGFTGSAATFGNVGEFNDGGVAFGPGGVLFTSRWPVNALGQTKPGSTDEDKIIDLTTLGVAGSHAAINFVPAGFGGAGRAKLVSWSGGQWYDAVLAPDGLGTFDLTGLIQIDLDLGAAGIQVVPGGPEGFVYIAGGNPLFAANTMLISEFSANLVSAYDLDANGNPLVSTRRTFVSGLAGAEGAAIDPVTGDFLFSTFGGSNQVIVVQGFNTPDPGGGGGNVPEPATLGLLGLGALLLSRKLARRA
jgi:PEP-CTERM motif